MCSTKIKASALLRMFCLLASQVQHFADGQETHMKTENKSKRSGDTGVNIEDFHFFIYSKA